MPLLLLSIAALLAGPILVGLANPDPRFRRALDGYVMVTIAGLVALHLAPVAFHDAGIWAGLALAAGAALPWMVERRLSDPTRARTGPTLFAVVGLALHALIDGAALAAPGDAHGHGHAPLAIAVIVHRLPVGLLVWWALVGVAGRRAVLGVLGLMVLTTVAGYLLGEPLLHDLPAFGSALFTALVSGALLHVLAHGVHPPPGHATGAAPLIVGGALGVITVAAITVIG